VAPPSNAAIHNVKDHTRSPRATHRNIRRQLFPPPQGEGDPEGVEGARGDNGPRVIVAAAKGA